MSELLAGRFRVTGTLGRGSMGVVHRAHDEILNRQVALKELVPPPGIDTAEAADRFLVEARAAAGLVHSSIVTVHDVVQDGDRVLMAMELLEGSTLAEVVAEAGRLDAASTRQVIQQVGSALAEAHSHGIVHRDLKPDNIFWLPNGRVVVCDFGLARIGAGRGTQVGTVMGTPGYMAPEQVRGLEAGPPADVFSLGAIAYELLAGTPPFGDPAREDQATLLYRVVNEELPPLDLPDDPGLAQLVASCLLKDPAQRPQQATEVVEALGGQVPVASSLPPATSQPPASQPQATRRRFNPLAIAGVGVGILLVALVSVLLAVMSGGGDETVTVTTAERFEAAANEDDVADSTIRTTTSTTSVGDVMESPDLWEQYIIQIASRPGFEGDSPLEAESDARSHRAAGVDLTYVAHSGDYEPAMRCCFWVVFAGPFPTKPAAQAYLAEHRGVLPGDAHVRYMDPFCPDAPCFG